MSGGVQNGDRQNSDTARVTRVIAVLYLAAVIVFLAGVGIRIAAGFADYEALSMTGELLNAGAWPIAVVGGILDIRHRRHRARARAEAEAQAQAESEAEAAVTEA